MSFRQSLRLPAALLAGILAFATAPSPAFAQEEKKEDQPKTKRTQTIRAKIFEKLEKAQEAADNNRTTEALGILDALRKEKLTDYELAMVWNFTGSIRYSSDDYRGAIAAFRQVIAQKDIPEAMRTTVLYGLAQLQFASELYGDALKTLSEWRKLVAEPSAESWALEGQIRYQMNDYRGSVQPLLTALQITRKQNRQPKEPWLAVLRASYYELGDNVKAAKILEVLVALYPKKAYWIQLAGLYGLLDREADQLAAMEAAWQQGLLDRGSELVNLAQLFMIHDVPYKAVRVLEAGMKAKLVKETYENLRLLAQALSLAQETERQVPILEKAAARAPDGEMHLYLGQAYIEEARWNAAANALSTALKKGLKRPETARIMLGTVLYNAGLLDQAQRAFESAMKHKKTEEVAKQWLRAVEVERRRLELVAAQSSPEA